MFRSKPSTLARKFVSTKRESEVRHAGVELLEPRRLFAATYYVALTGSDANIGDSIHPWRTIQKAANVATPGSTVHVRKGVYNENIVVRVSGSAGKYITFQADAGAIIDGGGRAGRHLLDLSNRSYVKIIGFELRNGKGTTDDDASGIRVEGAGNHLEFRSNRIHDMLGANAMGMTFYGVDSVNGIHDLVVDNNEIDHCEPATSESLTFNGNVYSFSVTNNRIHDNNNIGIDVIGGEGTCNVASKDQARGGTIANNQVWNCKSSYGGGFAAGIYVDGGRDTIIERNRVWLCNVGVEVGCEHAGRTASNVTVRDNVLYQNDKAGLAFGGYDSSVGRTTNSRFANNTLYRNGETSNVDNQYGQIWIQWASNCMVENNIAVAGANKRLIFFEHNAQSNVRLDYNVYYRASGSTPLFTYDGEDDLYSFSAYKSFHGQDAHSKIADPKFANPGGADFHLQTGSPAINAGNPTYVPPAGELDIDSGSRRLGGRVDAGADEKA